MFTALMSVARWQTLPVRVVPFAKCQVPAQRKQLRRSESARRWRWTSNMTSKPCWCSMEEEISARQVCLLCLPCLEDFLMALNQAFAEQHSSCYSSLIWLLIVWEKPECFSLLKSLWGALNWLWSSLNLMLMPQILPTVHRQKVTIGEEIGHC